jgi:hypothetical protein
LEVPPNSRVILHFRVCVLSFVADLVEPCTLSSLEHQVVRDVEDFKGVIRGFVYEKVEDLKLFWLTGTNLPSVHTCPEFLFSLLHVEEISQDQSSSLFQMSHATLHNSPEHIEVLNESGQSVAANHTVHFLRQLEIFIENIMAN